MYCEYPDNDVDRVNASQLSNFNPPLRSNASHLFQRRECFEIQYGVEFNNVPLFFKEGLGEIDQSVIMKVRLTDQHYHNRDAFSLPFADLILMLTWWNFSNTPTTC